MRTSLVALGIVTAITVLGLGPTRAGAACGSQGVYVFDAHWCPSCKQVKQMLARYNIRYQSIDTTSNPRARAFMAKHFNTTMIPVTVIDDSFVIGFNHPRLRELLCLN
jgi:glutaredoxin